ncbi:DNA polymerase III subunit epsilon [Bartonella sp. HY329]|uniref:DNA polymerase III subunit epsilon n=1 Tax=unclassified Bartonella TaxID=2645622 RepID=UPI0021CA4A23|nr:MULTISPECIES: DNA polymerase III subunit epsilon [unclassified Bartonella]UXM95256.1 DNA polymerase III subunit epsilon [Bartonella sp. HY329]UXN09580.1 DNA polymerase III subunit epsilon [Bartonella sp. HY328]
MREIIFDTETTGLDKTSDRVIEIGCVEMENRFLTGRTFHVYLNPQGKAVHPDALAVHGISNEMLADKPKFSDIVDEFLAFCDGAKLVAHNAMFDLGFINAELDRIGQLPISVDRIIDTLALARRKHPMGPNSLDALCKRYGIENSHRTLHGALLDSEILADVYIELIGGKQGALGLAADNKSSNASKSNKDQNVITLPPRPKFLAPLLTDDEKAAHMALLEKIGPKALWYAKTEDN